MTSFLRKRYEIGSEFWDIPLSENMTDLFSENTSWFMAGRCALERIIANIKAKKDVQTAFLPSWCCDSMITPFLRAGIEVAFYPVYVKEGVLIQDLECVGKCDILFVMDYFGYCGTSASHDRNVTVIRDVTHSVFTKKYTDADYYFGSLRKWCGFKTGGFAIGLDDGQLPTDERYFSLREAAMVAKQEYISGHSESKAFLQTFTEAEDYLEKCSAAGADPNEVKLTSRLDCDFIKSQRRKNAGILLGTLSDIAIFPVLGEKDCPLFVPITVNESDRTDLRRFLTENEIYCPIHWPISGYHKLNRQTAEIYNNELSIVCDQRYDENDMQRVANMIKDFFNKKHRVR